MDLTALLKEVKEYLKITWDDERTNSEIQRLINQADYFLRDRTGQKELDYSKDLDALSLLKDYCRYVRNYSLEYFEGNFQSMIWKLILKYAD